MERVKEDRTDSLRFQSRWIGMLSVFCVLMASCVMTPSRRQLAVHQWNRTRGPVVPHDSFPKDCSLCHESGSWNTIRSDFHFDHGRQTGVPLHGAHREAQCLRCHNDRGPVGIFAKRGCAGCHEDEHRGQLGDQCQQCHNQNDWIPEGQIARHNQTRFPLIGSHTAVACFRCHPGAQTGNFLRAPVRCEACHQAELARAKTPDHQSLGWIDNCERCHKPTSWTGSGFDHAKFALTGAHATAACSACHAGGVFTGLSHACVSCHSQDFQSTTSPNHLAANFSTNCQDCHNTIAWHGATFNHNGITSGCVQCHLPDYNATANPNHATNNFPTNCESCHNTQSWTGAAFSHVGITSGCSQCHLPDYNATTDPNHATNNFPTNCESCHNTQSWTGATFNHAGITSGCSQCHLPDYNATTNPNHAANGFPTNCESCHNTTSWQGASFNHTFNITSGAHRNYSCNECHQVPSNYNVVSCTHCHEHRQSSADSDHQGVPGYSWNSSACINCHPTGR